MRLFAGFAAALAIGCLAVASAEEPGEPTREQLCAERTASANERIRLCTAVIDNAATSPQDRARSYTERGAAYRDSGDANAAIADFDRSLAAWAAIRPSFPTQQAEAYYERGVLWHNASDYARAIAEYDLALNLNPNHFWAFGNRGGAKSGLSDFQGALDDLTRALNIDPNNATFRYRRGLALHNLSRTREAVVEYSTVINGGGLDSSTLGEAYLNRGSARMHVDSNDFDAAISDYEQAMIVAPGVQLGGAAANISMAYNNRGNARYQRGDASGALADFNLAARLDTNNQLAVNNASIIAGAQGQEGRREAGRVMGAIFGALGAYIESQNGGGGGGYSPPPPPPPASYGYGYGASADPPPTSNQTRRHNPSNDATQCILQHQVEGVNYLRNSCNFAVELVWCVVGSDCSPSFTNTWTLGAGARWPVAGQSVRYAACRGANSIWAPRSSQDFEYACPDQ